MTTEVRVPLTKGLFAVVDEADLPLLSGSKWRASQAGPDKWYACATRNGRTVYMHRVLMSPAEGILIDHRDGDGLNNRRSNLRFADKSGNGANSALSRRNKSGFKGVSQVRQRFVAAITFKGKRRTIGYFDTPQAAAAAYAIAAQAAHGEFANPVSKGGSETGKTLCLYRAPRGY